MEARQAGLPATLSIGRGYWIALVGRDSCSISERRIGSLEPGLCVIILNFRQAVAQQHGFFHGGVVGALADNAAAYAAFTLLASNQSALTVEYKVSLVAPSEGDRLKVVGQGSAGRQSAHHLPERHLRVYEISRIALRHRTNYNDDFGEPWGWFPDRGCKSEACR